jgi:transcriptional regulator with XRE-family HTH domain
VPTVISAPARAVESIGARLRRIRTMRGWTQVQLAEQSGLLQHTISQIESGAQKGECMQLATAMRLAWALGGLLDALSGMPAIPGVSDTQR